MAKLQTYIKLNFLFLMFFSVSVVADSWNVEVAPYLWAINMHGSTQVGPVRISVAQTFSDLMKHFQGGGMIFLNAHTDKWGIFSNALYSVLSDHETYKYIPLKLDNDMGIFSGGISYALLERKSENNAYNRFALEFLAGARYTLNNTKLKVHQFTFNDNQSWTDPIIGARLTFPLSNQWHFITTADGGGLNHHHSYDLQAYLGYQTEKPLFFSNTTLYLGYRLLHQYYTHGKGLNYYQWDMDIRGPILGIKTIF